MVKILSPTCPACGRIPVFILAGGEQCFCGNDDCRVFVWNAFIDPEEQLRDAQVIPDLDAQ